MANDIRDEHKEPRPEDQRPGLDAGRFDSDRDYAARNHSEGEQSTGGADRGAHAIPANEDTPRAMGRGDKMRAEAEDGRAHHDDRGVYGKPGAFYESQSFKAGERSGTYGEPDQPVPATGEGNREAGWRATRENEIEQPGAGDPLGDGVR